MSKKNDEAREQIRDMWAYLCTVPLDTREDLLAALVTITHDLGGIVRSERCFVPRTHGYFMRKLAGELERRAEGIKNAKAR